MTTFIGTGTATDYDTAVELATASARSQALETYGPNAEFYGVDDLFVKFDDAPGGGVLYRARFTLKAREGVVPPPVVDPPDTPIVEPPIVENPEPPVPPDPPPEPPLPPPTEKPEPPPDTPVVVVPPSPAEDPESRNEVASVQSGKKNNAQGQQVIADRNNTPGSADWRVKISLAKGSTYLYNAGNQGSDAGILKPLAVTQGVVFPYTPSIETNYTAKYDPYDLTHSNYKGYFYRSSSVGEIQIKGTFTAQDTKEAEYLLAVIHFFRSVTKMFYGQDPQRGAPPPLVFLTGLGQYQFNNHPCVVSSFNYSLPTDVDYIRAHGFNKIGLNLENRRDQSSGPTLTGSLAVVNRLFNNFLTPGGEPKIPSPLNILQNNNNTNSVNSTYVPTKMEISVTLLPMQTRNQISQQFSLQGFANGQLLKGGFW